MDSLLAGFALLLAAAVTNGWGWPVVGDNYRAGALVLFVVASAPGSLEASQSWEPDRECF